MELLYSVLHIKLNVELSRVSGHGSGPKTLFSVGVEQNVKFCHYK